MKTLKISFSLLVLSLFFTSLHAQIAMGLRGGMHYAKADLKNQSVEAFANIKNINNLNLAVFAEIPMMENISFQPELSYLKKGFSTSIGTDFSLLGFPLEVGAKAETELKYLEVPLLLKYKFGNERIKGYVLGGPTVGYAMSGKLKTIATVLVDFTVAKTDINLANDNFQRFEVGGMIGVGGEVNVGTGELFADFRYHHGLTNMLNDPIIDAQLTNQGFGLNIGYKFYLN